ncbi:hypothetical protein ERJ75_001133300 [Trypanosoma vivax]|nr:hypothetical protein ERJ75_001133300 [Trypanosoma vivax]
MAPRESGTHWPPGWKTQDERTSTGTRGERLVEKNSGAKDGARGVAHNESPASRRTKAQVGRMVERGQSDKGKRGTATQTWGHARKEILRRLTRNTGHSQRGTATQPAAASATGTRGGAEAKRGLRRRWSEQRRECSTEERPKEGCEEGGNERAADEQGAKVTQQWRLNGKGAQGDALPCDRWRSEGREERHTEAVFGAEQRATMRARCRSRKGVQSRSATSGQHRETRVVLATRRSRKEVTLRAGKWAHAPPAKRGRKARHWRRVENTLTNEGGVQERKTLFGQRVGEEGGQRRGG